MKAKLFILGSVALAGLVAACHDNHQGAAPPAPSTALALDTAHVLQLAQLSSETTNPSVVNGGAITITDTSETSQPLVINGM